VFSIEIFRVDKWDAKCPTNVIVENLVVCITSYWLIIFEKLSHENGEGKGEEASTTLVILTGFLTVSVS
jgi:hypothetical protein